MSALGQQRIAVLKAGTEQPNGRDNDTAAVCLLRLGIPPLSLAVQVQTVTSTYKVASGATSGFFKTGQDADILLSGFGFNDAGGPLVFNHPGGIATDGTRLYMSDTFNNRVLVWNTLPKGNVAPDFVLGQKDFKANNPGIGRDQLDWPTSITTDGKRLLVADTNNYRILIWNSIPTKSGQPADLVLLGGTPETPLVPGSLSKTIFIWPWGVWTNGEKLVVSSTGTSNVLIWNQFPTKDNQPADIVLAGQGKIGTPRHITSDGKSLIVGDHNAKVEGQPGTGSFFWKTFPTKDDQPFDFYMPGEGPWLRGAFTADGKLILTDAALRIWNSFPKDASTSPDLSVNIGTYLYGGGDYETTAVAGNSVYISAGNANKILVYNSIPTRADQPPDFAIGSPDIKTNTLDTNFIMSNPVPVSNGKSLFVTSDFDYKLYVFKQLPDESGAHPDFVYSLEFSPFQNALWGNTFAVAGSRGVMVWKELPVKGQLPDLYFKGSIGSVQFGNLVGIAMDDKYFYLADSGANKVYVWRGIPSQTSEPAFTLNVEGPSRMSSDGNYLTMGVPFLYKVLVWPVANLSAASQPASVGGVGIFNTPGMAVAALGHLFITDGFNHVLIWRNIQDALSGKAADAVLGANLYKGRGEIGRNTFFAAVALSFDGSYLWVGETKFSERLLRFSPSP